MNHDEMNKKLCFFITHAIAMGKQAWDTEIIAVSDRWKREARWDTWNIVLAITTAAC